MYTNTSNWPKPLVVNFSPMTRQATTAVPPLQEAAVLAASEGGNSPRGRLGEELAASISSVAAATGRCFDLEAAVSARDAELSALNRQLAQCAASVRERDLSHTAQETQLAGFRQELAAQKAVQATTQAELATAREEISRQRRELLDERLRHQMEMAAQVAHVQNAANSREMASQGGNLLQNCGGSVIVQGDLWKSSSKDPTSPKGSWRLRFFKLIAGVDGAPCCLQYFSKKEEGAPKPKGAIDLVDATARFTLGEQANANSRSSVFLVEAAGRCIFLHTPDATAEGGQLWIDAVNGCAEGHPSTATEQKLTAMKRELALKDERTQRLSEAFRHQLDRHQLLFDTAGVFDVYDRDEMPVTV